MLFLKSEEDGGELCERELAPFLILVPLLPIGVRENFQERDGREVETIKLQIFIIQNMLLPGH